jgi:hypothetical protein
MGEGTATAMPAHFSLRAKLIAARNGPAKSNLRGESKMRYRSAIRSALVSVYLFCGLACAVFVLFVPDALAKKPPSGPPPPPALSFSP